MTDYRQPTEGETTNIKTLLDYYGSSLITDRDHYHTIVTDYLTKLKTAGVDTKPFEKELQDLKNTLEDKVMWP